MAEFTVLLVCVCMHDVYNAERLRLQTVIYVPQKEFKRQNASQGSMIFVENLPVIVTMFSVFLDRY